ncbi:Uma2 family endonuclease [Candidatus Poriferisodalis sp.]|uniref:Uma2 family endonuclease n=1 Tax=Candidatus Poriferisodalis sp. TaxID=3101277 RepID=UPI003B01363C
MSAGSAGCAGSAGQLHGKLALRLGARLADHAEAHGLGTVVGTDSGVLVEHDPDTVREPDLALTSTARLPPGQVSDGYAEVVPDLVVEVASPNDRPGELAERAAMWLGFGVRLVWVVHPGSRTVQTHRAGTDAVGTLTETNSLDGGSGCPASRTRSSACSPCEGNEDHRDKMTAGIRASSTPPLTADDLLQLDDGVRGEFVRGVFREMPRPRWRHGQLVA